MENLDKISYTTVGIAVLIVAIIVFIIYMSQKKQSFSSVDKTIDDLIDSINKKQSQN